MANNGSLNSRRLTVRAFSLLLPLLLPLTLTAAESLKGKVVGVHDGDTLTLLVNGNEQVKVRFYGIDAPESHQAFGTQAKKRLSELVFGKDVTVTVMDKDRYGRTVGKVYVGDTYANLELVKAGMAWHYVEYARNDTDLAKAQDEAKAAHVGLWQDANPTPPWDFRKGKDDGAQDATPEEAKPAAQSAPAAAAGAGYWLNTKSNVRHNSKCKWYRNTKEGRPCGATDGKACGQCGG